MPSRAPKYRSLHYLGDPDVLHAAIVTVLAVLLSAGLVWLAYLWHMLRVARSSPVRPPRPMTALVFGRKLSRGAPDLEFAVRLQRALSLAQNADTSRLFLLGGHSGDGPSEAAAGSQWLRQHDAPAAVELVLEQQSVDSFENLKNARRLLRDGDDGAPLPPVALVTSRYHLARCLMLARRLGFDATPVAAEPRLVFNALQLRRLWLESGYLMWIDLGVRWADLTGLGGMARRMR